MKNRSKSHRPLTVHHQYRAGRDSAGHVSIGQGGGRHKRLYRIIDFMRNKHDVPGRIASIEYDPNRGANIALVVYNDGEKRYILAPETLSAGQTVTAGETASFAVGNALPVSKIPIGTQVHNIELTPGSGGKMARGAGNYASVMGKEGIHVRLKLPSGEIRLVDERCYATIGQLSNIEKKHEKLGKAGRKRHLGFRPTVRGVAQNPRSHPHGGGEGRSGIGMPSPKSPWGKKTLGVRTRNNKRTNKFIVQRRSK